MQSRTIRQTTLFLCLLLSTFLHSQITINYPENLTVECGTDITPSTDNPVIGYPDVSTTCASGLTDISFSDNIDRLVDCGGTGILLRFWTINDNCGGFKTLLQTIKIEDTTPPEINCVANVVIECDASLNPAENPDLVFPEVIDCSEGEDLTISYIDLNEGDGFCDNLPEIVRRTWTVTDACGNESTCEQAIRVGKDPLLVFCEIEDIVHECNGLDGSRFAAESWDLSNTNQLRNCTQTECGPVEIISDFDYGRIDGTCGITGSFEVNYLIKDNCGNTKFKTVSFTLRDTTPPESFCNPIDFGVSCEGDETAASRVAGWHADNLALLETCLFDNCGDVIVSSDFDTTTFNIGTLNFDCNDDTGFAVNYTLTDQCGNVTVKPAFLKVVDNAAPTFENVPRDTSIGANDNLPVGQPTVVDNCASNLSYEFSEERIDNDNDNGYQLIRTWTTTDDCGNMGTATQRVMVLDPILSLACTSAEIKQEGDKIIISELLAPNEIVKVFASDNRIVYNCFRNCGEVQTTRSLAEDTYTVSIQFYTTDWRLICTDEKVITIGNGGNNNGGGDNNGGEEEENEDPCTAADCEQVPPTIDNLPADMTVNEDAIPAVATPTTSDNCDTDVNLTFMENRTEDANSNDYVLTRTWTAVDDCGNISTGEQVIRVVVADDSGNNGGDNGGDNNNPCTADDCETTPPIIGNIPNDETVNYEAVPAPAQPVATDNCDTDVSLVLSETISESIDARNYTLTRTWTATDDCGNEATGQQVIKVEGDSNTGDNGGGDNGGGDNGGGDNSTASDCEDVTITTGALTFNFTNLNAPNKIVKVFDENYNIILECVEGCGTEVSFSYETVGTYFADVQLYTSDWAFICETRKTVELTDMPIDNGGNGNGGNTNLCEEIAINMENGAINVSNINSPNKIVKLFNENYDIVSECSIDCGAPASFNMPPAGNYFVDVQLYTADWTFLCEVQEPINVSTTNNDGGNDNGGDNGDDGNDNQSDDPCENVQINSTQSSISLSNFSTTNKIVNIFDENFNQIYNCFTDCPSDVNVSISELGSYLIEVQLYNNEWVLVCQQRTTLDITENSPTDDSNDNSDNNEDNTDNQACNVVDISIQNGQVNVSNLDAPNTIVKVFNENFDIVFECVGNCGNSLATTDLIAGNYQVNVDFFNENWSPICEKVEAVNIGNNLTTSNNPNSTPITTARLANTTEAPAAFSIYPNPATNEVTLNFSKVKGENVSFLIYNQLAAVIKKGKINVAEETTFRIGLQDVENGLYFVQIQVEGQASMTKKLLVNK